MRVTRGIKQLGVLGALVAAVLVVVPAGARADETTLGYSALRSSWDATEPGLTQSAVAQPDFGQLWSATLPRPVGQTAATFPNQVYAQPLVVGGRVVVATEENQVDAVDAKTGALDWSVSLGPAWAPTFSCGNISPRVGITGTPVYDPATGAVYLVTKTDDGIDADHPTMRMHALNVTTGAELPGWPVKIAGSATNSGLAFNSLTANQRTGLLLMGGSVYFATASHCDHGPYVGFVGGITTGSTPHLSLWSSEATASNLEAGIWQSGGGLVSDGPGRILLATGNGVSPAPGPGTSPPGTLAESVVRLAVGPDGSMTAVDYFSPANNLRLDQTDADFGSGAPVPLPDDYGSAAHRHLLTITGKDGIVRLLDRDALGGTAQGPGGTDAVVSSLTLKGVWGRAAVFDTGTAHYLYLLPSTSPLEALRVEPNASGVPTLSVVGASADSYGYSSGSPVVTSNGNDPASAVVWLVTVTGSDGSGAMLRAFPAVPPPGGNWRPIASYPLGTAAKFVQPATDNGRVFVGTRDGNVLAFGRPTAEAISAPATDFGLIPVGSTATQTVTITANAPVTIDGTSADPPFSLGTPTPALPSTLAAGNTVSLPVTFAPTTPDTFSNVLTVHTHNGTGATYDYVFALSGTGTQDGVAADPSALDFGTVVTGVARQLGVTIRNTGTTSTTVTSSSVTGAAFSTSTLPPDGFVLAPQASVTVTVLFTPTALGAAAGSLSVSTSTGSVSVPLTGTGETGAPHLTVSSGLTFGQVPPGATRTLDMVVTNTGTAGMTIEKAALPSAPYYVPTPVGEGQQLAPSASLIVPIKVTPRTAMAARDAYSITADDGQGPLLVPLRTNTGRWTGPLASNYGCIDIWANARANGAEADLFTCNGGTAQQFTFDASSALHVGPASTQWCLGARGGGTKPGTLVQLFTCDRSAGQVFTWDSANRLVNPHAKLCLATRNAATSIGTPLVLATCNTSAGQRWDASPLLGARGEMTSLLAGVHQICLSDPGAPRTPGARLVIGRCITGAGQIVTRHGSPLRLAGQCVTAATVAKVSSTTVSMQPCTGAAAQSFPSISNGRLQNPTNKLCLTVQDGHTAPYTKVWLTACSTAAAQRWRLPGG